METKSRALPPPLPPSPNPLLNRIVATLFVLSGISHCLGSKPGSSLFWLGVGSIVLGVALYQKAKWAKRFFAQIPTIAIPLAAIALYWFGSKVNTDIRMHAPDTGGLIWIILGPLFFAVFFSVVFMVFLGKYYNRPETRKAFGDSNEGSASSKLYAYVRIVGIVLLLFHFYHRFTSSRTADASGNIPSPRWPASDRPH